MVSSSILTLVVLGIFSSQILQQTEAGEDKVEDQLIGIITTKLFGLWTSDTVDFLSNTCNYRITPKIRKWKLKYDGKFWCPGLAPFSGRSLKSSRSGAVEHAIKDFVKKAISKKIVDKEEVDIWLKGNNG